MRIGFHTTGLLLHDETTAITELAALGYQCVAIRPRLGGLNPKDPHFGETLLRVGDAAASANVQIVIDLDSLFMHDPRITRMPSLVADDSDARATAQAWIQQWIATAGELGSQLLTVSSGVTENERPGGSEEHALERLAAELDRLLDVAGKTDIRLALRPRHGDLIATVAQFERLGHWLDDASRLLLAADVGEMLVGHEFPVADRLARNLESLACVYLCDHRSGTTGDQRIGQGDVALTRVVRSLREHGFDGPAIVRVEGHSQWGLSLAVEALHVFDG